MVRKKTIRWMGKPWNVTEESDIGFVCRRDGLVLVIMRPPGEKWIAALDFDDERSEVTVNSRGHETWEESRDALEVLVRRAAGLPAGAGRSG